MQVRAGKMAVAGVLHCEEDFGRLPTASSRSTWTTTLLKVLRIVVLPLLALWLVAWMGLSWPAIQDDALIHLRYADFLYSRHFITFDGVHPSFGASSLLYVGLLALLRSFTASPLLSRAVSSAAHVALFVGFGIFYWRNRHAASERVQLLTGSLLLMLAAPSAVRWLDDGMETGLVLCGVAVLVLVTHRISLRAQVSASDFLLGMMIGFALVFLRIELATAAFFASLILVAAAGLRLRALPGCSHLVVGAMLAGIAIRLLMHSFLPDTALAKSHGFGAASGSLRAAATVLAGALLFGVGSLVLWLISAAMVFRHQATRRVPTLIANAIFPFVLGVAALRGQEIQGARYLVWCFFFSICWNLLELRRVDADTRAAPAARALAVFLICCVAVLPFESHWMYRVLTTRAHTMRIFMAADIAQSLQGHLGVAGDVGYISYFSRSNLCDLSGLVNGRATARMSGEARAQNCAAQHPEFALLNSGQADGLGQYLDLSAWKVCGAYDFGNLRDPDRHYLLVAPALAEATCHATGFAALPESSALVAATYP